MDLYLATRVNNLDYHVLCAFSTEPTCQGHIFPEGEVRKTISKFIISRPIRIACFVKHYEFSSSFLPCISFGCSASLYCCYPIIKTTKLSMTPYVWLWWIFLGKWECFLMETWIASAFLRSIICFFWRIFVLSIRFKLWRPKAFWIMALLLF